MGYDYYCLLGAVPEEGKLSRSELALLKKAYLALVEAGDFPLLGAVGHSSGGGLGSGLNAWARAGLLALTAAAPGRTLALWCVYWDLTIISRVQARDGTLGPEEFIAGDGEYREGPCGVATMPRYPVGSVVIPRDLSEWLEPSFTDMDPGVEGSSEDSVEDSAENAG
jgi:hypothetical protein